MKVQVVNKEAQVMGDVDIQVDEKTSPKQGVLFNRVIRSILMNARQGTASAKTRSYVSGGGKKPWKQKGTGRARAGSNRSPLWRGGGVIFGPEPRDYDIKINKKEKKKAFNDALLQRIQDNGLVVVDSLEFDEPKTKDAVAVLEKLGVSKALIILDNDMKNAYLSMRNIDGVEIRNISSLNTYDLLKFRKIIIPKSIIEKVNRRVTNG